MTTAAGLAEYLRKTHTESVKQDSQSLQINDRVTVLFNPSRITNSLMLAFNELYTLQMRSEAESVDGDMKDILNSIFEEDICSPVLGSVMPSWMSDTNVPLWANLMLGIMGYIAERVPAQDLDLIKNNLLIADCVSKYNGDLQLKKYFSRKSDLRSVNSSLQRQCIIPENSSTKTRTRIKKQRNNNSAEKRSVISRLYWFVVLVLSVITSCTIWNVTHSVDVVLIIAFAFSIPALISCIAAVLYKFSNKPARKAWRIFVVSIIAFVVFLVVGGINECEHNWVFEETIAPTCEAYGYDLYKCDLCGASEKRNKESALGHSFEGTKNEDGEVYSVCSRCGKKVVSKKSKKSETEDSEPVFTSEGKAGFTLLLIIIAIPIIKSVRKDKRYQQILDDIQRRGGRVVYQNRQTGTISAQYPGGVRQTYSAYRGYNSKV